MRRCNTNEDAYATAVLANIWSHSQKSKPARKIKERGNEQASELQDANCMMSCVPLFASWSSSVKPEGVKGMVCQCVQMEGGGGRRLLIDTQNCLVAFQYQRKVGSSRGVTSYLTLENTVPLLAHCGSSIP